MISIIVPIYNAERVLSRCIDSIQRQTYKDIEIILINDGSNDNSLKICNEYAHNDQRIMVIDIPNEGVSNARNTGLGIAQGDYIGFVDSDDYIEPQMFDRMIKKIKSEFADVIFCDYFSHKNNGKKVISMSEFAMDREKIVEELIPKFLSPISLSGNQHNMHGGAVWRCLFKKTIITESNIQFNTELKIAEDLVFLLEYLSKTQKVSFINEPLYNYITVDLGSTTQKFIKEFEYQIDRYYYELDRIFEKFNYNNIIDFAKLQSFQSLISNYCKKDSGYKLNQIIKITKNYAREHNLPDKINKFNSDSFYFLPKFFRRQFKYNYFDMLTIASYLRHRFINT